MTKRKEVMTIRQATLVVGVVAGVALALFTVLGSGGGTALADGGPHVVESGATPDKCAACHRIHTGENEYLLKDAGTIEDFCFSCHGNGGPGSDLAVQEGTFYGGTTPGAPYGGKTASTTVGLRAGGFEMARINTTDPSASVANTTPPPTTVPVIGVLAAPEAVNSRHTLEVATTLWGNGPVGTVGAGPAYTLECTSCHDPHGNGNYRILRSVPTGSGGAGYTIPDTYPKTPTDYTVDNYAKMQFGALPANLPAGSTPVPGSSILVDTSAWCAQCHTRYLARGGRTVPPASEASRADSGDAIYTYRHTSAGWSISSSTGAVSFNNRACITCHATHGSNAQMPGGATGTTYSSTVPWPDGSLVNPNDPQRASMLKMDNRGMCRKCHTSVQ
jgi:predicted CXXCH cytochrome family protein